MYPKIEVEEKKFVGFKKIIVDRVNNNMFYNSKDENESA